jgi:hypothetical protein
VGGWVLRSISGWGSVAYRLALSPAVYLMGAMSVTVMALLLLARAEMHTAVASPLVHSDGDTLTPAGARLVSHASHPTRDTLSLTRPRGGGGGFVVDEPVHEQPQPEADAPQPSSEAEVALTAADCPVTAVTVYSDRADVQRSCRELSLPPGTSQVGVAGVTSSLVPNSVRVSGAGAATLLAVTERDTFQQDLANHTAAMQVRVYEWVLSACVCGVNAFPPSHTGGRRR